MIKLFAYFAKHRTYKAGETILTQGMKANDCFFVLHGEIEVSTRHQKREVIIQHLAQNSFLGELALLARFEWFFSARALTETELLITDRESFQKILEKYPEKRERITEKIIQLQISRFENQTSFMLDRLIDAGIGAGSEGQPILI
jgi:CRP-like cAMP-binding protein